MKVLAFAASNSRHSINRTLVAYTAGLIEGADVEIIDIADYEMPIFSEDRERVLGQPEPALSFYRKIGEADALVISFAEHNGGYTAAYKNLFDWTSRIDRAVFQDKPVVFLSTSPGPRGGAGVLASAVNSAGHFGADLAASLSFPGFHENFDTESGQPVKPELRRELRHAMRSLIEAVSVRP